MMLLVSRIIVEIAKYASKIRLDPCEALRYVSEKLRDAADIFE